MLSLPASLSFLVLCVEKIFSDHRSCCAPYFLPQSPSESSTEVAEASVNYSWLSTNKKLIGSLEFQDIHLKSWNYTTESLQFPKRMELGFFCKTNTAEKIYNQAVSQYIKQMGVYPVGLLHASLGIGSSLANTICERAASGEEDLATGNHHTRSTACWWGKGDAMS